MTAEFWERRYARGGHSGAGSRGREAEWKAALVSSVIRRRAIRSILDLGAGDGHVAARLKLGACTYLGVERSAAARALAAAAAPKLRFVAEAPAAPVDLVLSLDVVFHLVDDAEAAEYFRDLFALAARFVLIYGYCDEPKRPMAAHVRHRNWRPFIPPGWLALEAEDGRAMEFKQAWLLGRLHL